MESSKQNGTSISETICPTLASIWQVGLSDIVLLKDLRPLELDNCYFFGSISDRKCPHRTSAILT